MRMSYLNMKTINLYRHGKITLREAAVLCNSSLREMLEILNLHGVSGNIQYDTQSKSLEIVRKVG